MIKKSLFIILINLLVSYLLVEGLSYILSNPLYANAPNENLIFQIPYISDLKPFRVKTNNCGFRNDRDFVFPIKKTKPRILLLGDSLMFGKNSSYGPGGYLSDALTGYEVFNGSSIGGNSGDYYRVLKFYCKRIHPDYIFVGLFLGNDFGGKFQQQRDSYLFKFVQLGKRILPNTYTLYRNLKIKRSRKTGIDRIHDLSTADFKSQTILAVRQKSRRIFLCEKEYQRKAEMYDYDVLFNKYPGLKYSETLGVIADAILYQDMLEKMLMLKDRLAVKNYEDSLRDIEEIISFVNSQNNGVRLAFVLFPVSFMMDSRYAVFYRDLGYIIPAPEADYPLYKRLKTDLSTKGYKIIDLHDIFKDKDVYFKEDWHMNELGCKLTASSIAEFIKLQEKEK